MNDNKAVAAAMRKAHEVCDDHEDVATASLLENYIDATEKRTWFLFESARKADADPATDAFPVASARVNDVSGEGGLLPSPAS